MSGKSIDKVRALETARFAAMVDSDIDQLRVLLNDDMNYVHSNGKCETKQQFLDALESGRRRYLDIQVKSQELRQFGDTVVVIGRLWMELSSANGPLPSSMTYTAVHVLQQNQWQLISWQATRTAAE